MKSLYSLFLLVTLLFTASGCEDDYRSMVLFEGVEPIYQIGTCTNITSSLDFYLSETKGETVLGIDGGDGSYRLTNEHESVASVAFSREVNGYQRISVRPLAAGETVVTVADGSGESFRLHITVKERRQFTMTKRSAEYGVSGDVPEELPGEVAEVLSGRAWLEDTGYYILVPDAEEPGLLHHGVLEIYPTGKEEKPLVGSYDTVTLEGEDGETYAQWQFTYNGEQRLFTRVVRQSLPVNTECMLIEDVTTFCPSGLLPAGVLAVCRELFTLQAD